MPRNDNEGALFKNDRKEADTHPDYKGQADIAGVGYWMDAWINESQKDGKKYMKVRFKPKDQQPINTPQPPQSRPQQQPGQQPTLQGGNEDIPF
jgi:uncharacterized protein (DUF736 family)